MTILGIIVDWWTKIYDCNIIDKTKRKQKKILHIYRGKTSICTKTSYTFIQIRIDKIA